MKRRMYYFWFLIAIAAVLVPFLFIFDIKAAIIYACTITLILLYAFLRQRVGQEEIIALLFALFITSYHHYAYQSDFDIVLGTINLYPLLGWTTGLVILRELYERSKNHYRFLYSCLLYWVVLFALEYVGYYLFSIRLNSNYPSLAHLGIIHGPFVIYAFYLLAGPAYLLVTDYLHVK
jgi:hypothetical protein